MRDTCTALIALALVVHHASAECTTEVGVDYGGNDLLPLTPRNASSYGECCDLCIQTSGCQFWTYDATKQPTGAPSVCWLKTSDSGRTKNADRTSGWAGTGPAPAPTPPPAPAPAPGKWSAPHVQTSCASSPALADLGRQYGSLDKCQVACAANASCDYVNYGPRDNHCVLFADCSSPACEDPSGTGWWITYQLGRDGGKPWSGCKEPPSGPTPAPGPGPGPTPAPAPGPGDPGTFDCQVRFLAVEHARRALASTGTRTPEQLNASVAMVVRSLALDGSNPGKYGTCGHGAAFGSRAGGGTAAALATPLATPAAAAAAAAATTSFYVDASKGSDSNAGTSSAAPFKTLPRAQAAVRAALASSPATGVTVTLRAGTFFLSDTLLFGPADGGASADAPVVWAASPGEEVVVSGGVDLSGRQWTPSATPHNGAYETTVGGAGSAITTLFVGGQREIRAKFPNGDPLVPGGAGWGARASGPAAGRGFSATGQEFAHVVNVTARASGVTLSTGAAPGDVPQGFEVDAPLWGFNPTRADFHAFQNGSAQRFNTTFNHPFWNSQVSPGFTTDALTNKKWADPSTGIVHMYHSGGWGGWQFRVAERPDDRTVMFQCRQQKDGKLVTCPAAEESSNPVTIEGGFQECRGADIGSNAFYVENIEEELDDAREWFLKGQTLMYIPANGTNGTSGGGFAAKPPAADVPVVGGVLKRVIEVNGAAHLTLRGLTLSHTAPTYMDSYECPSGGDWSIHRGAALFVDGATDITLESLSFDQVSGNAVMFSNAVNNSAIRGCTFTDVGDSAIALLGSTQLMVGTSADGKGLFPTHNLIEGNMVDTVGVYGKQTSAYFKAKCASNVVRNNVFMNGPRAMVNFK